MAGSPPNTGHCCNQGGEGGGGATGLSQTRGRPRPPSGGKKKLGVPAASGTRSSVPTRALCPPRRGLPAPGPAPTAQGGAGTRLPLGLGLLESSLGKPERGGHGRGHRQRAAVEGEAGGGHFRGRGARGPIPAAQAAALLSGLGPGLRPGPASYLSSPPPPRPAQLAGPPRRRGGGGAVPWPHPPPSAAPPALHPGPPRPRAPALPAPALGGGKTARLSGQPSGALGEGQGRSLCLARPDPASRFTPWGPRRQKIKVLFYLVKHSFVSESSVKTS